VKNEKSSLRFSQAVQRFKGGMICPLVKTTEKEVPMIIEKPEQSVKVTREVSV